MMVGLAGPTIADGGQDGKEPPLPPIEIIKQVTRGGGEVGVMSPERVTISNSYYPYYGGAVKSDGYAYADFNQLSWSRIECKSRVTNARGQQGAFTPVSPGAYGGCNCPRTAKASLSGVVPCTYTSWTFANWHWLDGSPASDNANQSHYEDINRR